MTTRTLFIAVSLLITIGVFGRLLPHLPNATPITAIIFGSSLFLGRRLSLVVPLAVLLLTDLIIGLYSLELMLAVYGSFALVILLSWWSKKRGDVLATGYTILSSSLLFYLITNTAVWWFSPWYEKSFAGLLYCFEIALPFFRNMLLGDMIYVPLVLGALYLVTRYDQYSLTLSPKEKAPAA